MIILMCMLYFMQRSVQQHHIHIHIKHTHIRIALHTHTPIDIISDRSISVDARLCPVPASAIVIALLQSKVIARISFCVRGVVIARASYARVAMRFCVDIAFLCLSTISRKRAYNRFLSLYAQRFAAEHAGTRHRQQHSTRVPGCLVG